MPGPIPRASPSSTGCLTDPKIFSEVILDGGLKQKTVEGRENKPHAQNLPWAGYTGER